MKCDYCNEDFSESKWEKGVTYEGIDSHHNPPEFLSDFLKEQWSGEFYNLCRKHHRELHDQIILLLNKKANTLKFIKSEYWVLQKMNLKQIEEVKEEIIEFTRRWINDGNSNTA
jgi:hypothetical protein